MTLNPSVLENDWLKSGVLLTLGENGEVLANIPSGGQTQAHPYGTYSQPVPVSEAGMLVLLRILNAQKRLQARERARGGMDAAPTLSQIEAWLRDNKKKVDIGKPTSNEPYLPSGPATYEDLFGE